MRMLKMAGSAASIDRGGCGESHGNARSSPRWWSMAQEVNARR
jgi:hypothetical protein